MPIFNTEHSGDGNFTAESLPNTGGVKLSFDENNKIGIERVGIKKLHFARVLFMILFFRGFAVGVESTEPASNTTDGIPSDSSACLTAVVLPV